MVNIVNPSSVATVQNSLSSLKELIRLVLKADMIEISDRYSRGFVVNVVLCCILFLISWNNIFPVMIAAIIDVITAGIHSTGDQAPRLPSYVICSTQLAPQSTKETMSSKSEQITSCKLHGSLEKKNI